MAEYVVKVSGRKKRRDAEKILSRDINKYIAEIFSNSDDSYKRLEQSGALTDKDISIIHIVVDKRQGRHEVTIIDKAEGMDESDMKKNFSVYGADTSGGSSGKKVRGLFGQEASDVLFNSALHDKVAVVQSIKNGRYCICKFLWRNDEQIIKISTPKIRLKEIRTKYGIEGNGTVVRFGIPDSVSIPKDLPRRIKNFYMFRFMLANKNRSVILEVVNKSSKKTHVLSYVFPFFNEGAILTNEAFEFDFEDKKIKGELFLGKMSIEEQEDYGELKILVHDDEDNVYDNTFFKFGDNHPGTDKLVGYVKLFGTSEIIRERLNREIPEEILLDNRDGLNRSHDFYVRLNNIIEPKIQEALDKINSTYKDKAINLDDNKDWNDAFREINRYFKEALEESVGGVETGTEAPSDGMRFARPQIGISTGKTYNIHLLVNTDIIPINSVIKIDFDAVGGISLNTNKFIIKKNDVRSGNLALKTLTIIGMEETDKPIVVVAKYDNKEAKLFVNVLDKEIHYPKYGLEFFPNKLTTKPNKKSKMHLYYDLKKFALGTIVELRVDQPGLKIQKGKFTLNQDNLLTDEVGVFECLFEGGTLDANYTITAEAKNYKTTALLQIRAIDAPPSGSSGLFTGVDIEGYDQFWQTYYHPKTGKIIINEKNKINLSQIGDLSGTNRLTPRFTREQNKYIAELCAFECSKQLVKRLVEGGKIEQGDFEKYVNELLKEKNKIYEILVVALKKYIG